MRKLIRAYNLMICDIEDIRYDIHKCIEILRVGHYSRKLNRHNYNENGTRAKRFTK
jgi:hypothetical protein